MWRRIVIAFNLGEQLRRYLRPPDPAEPKAKVQNVWSGQQDMNQSFG